MKFKEDNLEYYEDALLTKNIIWTIEAMHQLRVVKIWRHVRLDEYEVDAVAMCDTSEGRYERAVGFELKEDDIAKAIHQAKERRKYFNYFYVVINASTHSIVEYLIDYPDFKELKIGIIPAKDNVVVYLSNFISKIEIKLRSKEEIDKKTVDLFHYLKENWNSW